MSNHTLGWTSDDGPNVFALGWLARVVVTIIPKGGGSDALLKIKKLKRKTQRNVRNLINLATLFVMMEEGDD